MVRKEQMSDGRPRHRIRRKSLVGFIDKELQNKTINGLSTQGLARYIVVWALSRLSRNSIDARRVIYLLDTGKLLAIYAPTRVYRNTLDDKAFLAI